MIPCPAPSHGPAPGDLAPGGGNRGTRWEYTAPPEPDPAHEQPSGWAAFELDTDTTDPSLLSEARLIDAMVGFERLAAWAEARQARLVAEFARRGPSDDPSLVGSDRISATSPYAPD
ncbi:MAG: hypothetical protein JWR58_1975 [Pseudonocardia sp.]|nr:hypothetical protein [Pseudonocardia sp.]